MSLPGLAVPRARDPKIFSSLIPSVARGPSFRVRLVVQTCARRGLPALTAAEHPAPTMVLALMVDMAAAGRSLKLSASVGDFDS